MNLWRKNIRIRFLLEDIRLKDSIFILAYFFTFDSELVLAPLWLPHLLIRWWFDVFFDQICFFLMSLRVILIVGIYNDWSAHLGIFVVFMLLAQRSVRFGHLERNHINAIIDLIQLILYYFNFLNLCQRCLLRSYLEWVHLAQVLWTISLLRSKFRKSDALRIPRIVLRIRISRIHSSVFTLMASSVFFDDGFYILVDGVHGHYLRIYL